MKTKITLKSLATRICLLMAIGSFILMAFAPASRAGLSGPYTNDFYTLHLWHLQDTNGTIQYVGTNSVFQFDYATNPLVVPLLLSNMPGINGSGGVTNTQFTLAGQSGPGAGPLFSVTNYGYSASIMTTQFSCYYAPWIAGAGGIYPDPSYAYTNNSCSFVNTNTGAFTWEALVQPQVNLLTYTIDKNPEILAFDGPNSGQNPYTERAVQFRFDNATPSSGQAELEFNNISFNGPATNHQMIATLPTTGRDAVTQGQWYHVAVAYTGNAPTNGDPAHTLTFYWTLFDPTRTNADVLTNYPYAFCITNLSVTPHIYTNTYGYPSNSIIGCSAFAVGGSGRNAPGQSAGGSGFPGNIAEVRISDYYRHPNEFMFNTSPAISGPVVTGPSPTNNLVGYGYNLTLSTLVSGTQPIEYQWFQNGLPLAGQTNGTLLISNITFAANGNYQLFVTNAYGNTNSVVATVTVGANFDGLFNTGCGPQNNPLDQTAPGSVDLHWTIPGNPDTTTVPPNSPNAIVWSDGSPLMSGGGVAPPNGASVWVSSHQNLASVNKTPGTYTFQTTFQIDETVVNSNTVLAGTVGALAAAGGSTMQMFLNGVETDITLPGNPAEAVAPFIITNGLQPGSNTLACTAFQTGAGTAGENGFNLAVLSSVGAALTSSPAITNQPVGVTNILGSTVSFSAVAVGAPPLYYYWLSNGVPVTPPVWVGTALPYLSFVDTNFSPSQLVGTNYLANLQIVFSNYVGVTTSAVATLDVQIPPLTVTSAGVPIWNQTNNETNIVVYFSSAVDPVTATTPGNYSLNNGASILLAALGGAPGEVVLTTTAPLSPTTSYTLTVQNVNSSFGFTMNPSPTSIAVGTYPTTVLWVKASVGVTADSSGNVSQWNDLSGYGNNFVNSFGPPFDPLLATNASGYPVIRFTGTNETFMQANDSPNLEITNNLSIFAVVNFATLAGGTNGDIVSKTANNNIAAPYDYYANASVVQFYRGNGSTSRNVASTKLPSVGVTHILDVVNQGTNVIHRLDGGANGTGGLFTTIADGQDSSPVYIGTRFDQLNRLTGDMSELILVNSAMSSTDVASMENYLATEYSIQIPPVNTNPTNLLFSASNNQLTLSWPSDHTGWTLQVQTNSLSAGLSTNWVNVPGSTGTNQIAIPINLTNGSVFYRLVYP